MGLNSAFKGLTLSVGERGDRKFYTQQYITYNCHWTQKHFYTTCEAVGGSGGHISADELVDSCAGN